MPGRLGGVCSEGFWMVVDDFPGIGEVPATRRRNMAAIRGSDTTPELRVRKLLHRLGYRFRLHRRDLPGSPDVVLPRYRTVVFVHGCFWHRHPGCRYTTMPRTRMDFWARKFEQNVERDRRQQQQLTAMGWCVMIVWECELRDIPVLTGRLGKIRSTEGS
jgi:DNA mismatch endonuclease (patch repair protein)